MRLRVTWISEVHPYGAFMVRNGTDRHKVATWVDETKTPKDNIIIDVDQVRSDPDHAHYFACIKVAYDNLPEDMHSDFSSPEHLRKWALVKAGYCTEVITVTKSNAEARRTAAAMQAYDEFAIVNVAKRVVSTYKADSQSYDAMSRGVFHKSKQSVLEVLSTLIGTDVVELLRSTPRGQAEHRRSDDRTGLHDRGDEKVSRRESERPPHEAE